MRLTQVAFQVGRFHIHRRGNLLLCNPSLARTQSDVILLITEPDVVLACPVYIFALFQSLEYNCGCEEDRETDIVISIPASTATPSS